MGEGDPKASWEHRETKLLDRTTGAISWYSKKLNRSRLVHRTISVLVMIGGIFAPLLVAGSDFTTMLPVTEVQIKGAAIAITIMLAFLEGLKRIFRFEQRWTSYFWTRNGLRKARDIYRTSQIGKEVGSPEWIANFEIFRTAYYEFTDKTSRELLDLNSVEDKESARTR